MVIWASLVTLMTWAFPLLWLCVFIAYEMDLLPAYGDPWWAPEWFAITLIVVMIIGMLNQTFLVWRSVL